MMFGLPLPIDAGPPPPETQYHRRMRLFEMLARGGCIDTGDEPQDIVDWLDRLDREMRK